MRKIKTITCKNCGKASDDVYRNRKVFCDKQCSAEYRYKEFIQKWLINDPETIKGGEDISNHIRRYLHEVFHSKCEKCRWGKIHPKTKRVPLTINHIDGNYENNKKDNLELLCPNCHSLTDNYGSLNKGNGRKNRLQKLKDKT